MYLFQPLRQQHLPGETVRRDPAIRPHRLRRTHGQAVATHGIGELVYLTGKRRGRLAGVVHPRKPYGESASIRLAPW